MTPGFTRYAPRSGRSQWFLVSGRTFVAAFESTVADSIIDSLWWLAESDLASIESVVGAFPLAGDDAVGSFAVATISLQHETGDAHVTAVVRGSASVDVFSVGGARRFQAAGTLPWVLAEFRSVTGLVIGGDEYPTAPVATASVDALPLGTGIVDGDRLAWSLSPIERTGDSRLTRAKADEATTRDGEATGGTAEELGDSGERVEPDETIVRARADSGQARTAVPTEAIELPFPASITADPSLIPPGGWAGPIDEPQHDLRPLPDRDDTILTSTRRAVFAPSVGAVLGFRLGGADPIDLDLPALIGRSPRSPRVSKGVVPRLISVPSRDSQVSSTHVQLEQVGDAVVVTDLKSTNGTVVAAAGGASSRLKPGESIVVLPGARVDIGDGNIIEITPARDES